MACLTHGSPRRGMRAACLVIFFNISFLCLVLGFTNYHLSARPLKLKYTPSEALSASSREGKVKPSDIDVDSVSDAEALLACRAYLQRKNRLGLWKTQERRQQGRPPSMKNTTTCSDADTGFFWPDPTQLKYLYRPDSDFDADSPWTEMEDDENGNNGESVYIGDSTLMDGEVAAVPDQIRAVDIEHEEVNEDNVFLYTDYQSHIRRSRAARRTWSKPGLARPHMPARLICDA